MLIDSHAHLEAKGFDGDRDEVVERARQAGVEAIVTVGTTIKDCRKAVSLARQYVEVYAAIGIHPHDTKGIDEMTYDVLRVLAKEEKVVAYGEIGLDFFHNHSPREVQIRRFGEQLEVAEEIGLPIIIHDRNAHKEILRMLKGWKKRGVIHCFSGDADMAQTCLDMGFFISVPGTITFEKADTLRDVVRRIPLDRLLVETDAPWLTPSPFRGKRNEPAYVFHTAKKVAEIKGVSLAEVGRVTSENVRTLFGIDRGTSEEKASSAP
jgi:TatD DNase family protein